MKKFETEVKIVNTLPTLEIEKMGPLGWQPVFVHQISKNEWVIAFQREV